MHSTVNIYGCCGEEGILIAVVARGRKEVVTAKAGLVETFITRLGGMKERAAARALRSCVPRWRSFWGLGVGAGSRGTILSLRSEVYCRTAGVYLLLTLSKHTCFSCCCRIYKGFACLLFRGRVFFGVVLMARPRFVAWGGASAALDIL